MWSAVLCSLCLAYPIVAAHRATAPDALERWRAYLVCFGLVVLPLLAWPWWLPLRTELVLLFSLVLGAYDAQGAHAVYVRYVVPALRPWDEMRIHSADEFLELVEGRVRRAPSPVMTHPSPVLVDSEDDHES